MTITYRFAHSLSKTKLIKLAMLVADRIQGDYSYYKINEVKQRMYNAMLNNEISAEEYKGALKALIAVGEKFRDDNEKNHKETLDALNKIGFNFGKWDYIEQL